jgi:hypothetical protein
MPTQCWAEPPVSTVLTCLSQRFSQKFTSRVLTTDGYIVVVFMTTSRAWQVPKLCALRYYPCENAAAAAAAAAAANNG